MIAMLNRNIIRYVLFGLLLVPCYSFSGEPIELILSDLQYVGAFRVSDSNSGDGRPGFGQSRIAISSSTNTFFMTGNPNSTVAEYQIPKIVNSTNIDDLAFTGPPIQAYSNWEPRIEHKTPNNQIRNVGGMELVNGKLILSVYDAYDAASSAGFDVDNMVIIHDAFDLKNSVVTGYFEMQDNMFAAGWLSPIPVNLQADLGGNYLSGSARMASINGRWSMGPSAYSLDIDDLTGVKAGGTVPNTRLQKYPIDHRLWWHIKEANNWNYKGGHYFADPNCPSWLIDAKTPDNGKWKAECVLKNDIWTEVSRAVYGAIVPGTSTYLTVGHVGGLRKGMAYKNFPINGGPQPCSGECPYDYTDWDNFIWMFDVQDLKDHKDGLTAEYDAVPYEYGPIKLPFDDLDDDGIIASIESADYDPLNNRLYIVLGKADGLASFEKMPIVLVYEIALNRPKPPRLL